MENAAYFLAGCAFILIFNAIRDFFLMREMSLLMNFKSPSDYLFYKYEMQRLATDRKHWFKLPLPFLSKKKPEEVQFPKSVVEEDMKKKVETAVSAEQASREYLARRKMQQEQFSTRRQESSVIP